MRIWGANTVQVERRAQTEVGTSMEMTVMGGTVVIDIGDGQ